MQDILEKLYSLQRRGIVPGLERVRAMLERIDNPHSRLRAIHIAGTNGKGTVSSVIASVLMEAGETVGLYTSPHIRTFNERIRINGLPITDAEISQLYSRLAPIADEVGATFFEITTVMAFSKFSHTTSVCVLECGLGGRFDATNVVHPELAIITSIDYDHQEWLGDTLEKIAFEKAGILKHGVPAVIGEPRENLRSVFDQQAREVGAGPLFYLDDMNWRYRILQRNIDGMLIELHCGRWAFDRVFVPLHGEHQVRNVAIALLALEQYWNINPPKRDPVESIVHGLAHLRNNSGLRGRIEVVRQDPLLVFDVAHNLSGCQALVKVLSDDPFPRTWNVVFGVMRDKDYSGMLTNLANISRRFYLASPRGERAANAETLAECAAQLGVPFEIHRSIAHALDAACSTDEPTVCTGSFFTIEEAFEYLDQLRH
jgi:dihydrofolate synthase/folylpolyglutamate synthase